MGIRRTLAFSVVMATVVAWLPAGLPGAGAVAQLTVTPSANLVHGQTVSIAASGLPARFSVAFLMCSAAPSTSADCDVSTLTYGSTDASGSVTVPFVVHSAVNTTGAGLIDCEAAPGTCVVAASTDLSTAAASAPLTFAAPAALRAGAVTISSTPVSAGDPMAVDASGFASGSVLAFALCASDATTAGDCDGALGAGADAAGAARLVELPSATLTTTNGRSIDCSVAGNCSGAAWDVRDRAATIAMSGYTVMPRAVVTVSVSPSTGLAGGQLVTVSGSASSSAALVMSQCAAPVSAARCPSPRYFSAGSDGSYSQTVAVTASLVIDGTNVDCATAAGTCAIGVADVTDLSAIAVAPLAFAPSGSVRVASHYSAAQAAILAGAKARLGVSGGELQRRGASCLAWVLGAAGAGVIAPLRGTGAATVSTSWGPVEYAQIRAAAALHGVSVAEFQKEGALLLAYVVAHR